jgi:hypothetical protein
MSDTVTRPVATPDVSTDTDRVFSKEKARGLATFQESRLERSRPRTALANVVARGEDIQSDANKLLFFLANYGEGDRVGRFMFQGPELVSELGIPATRLNDAVELMCSRGWAKTEKGVAERQKDDGSWVTDSSFRFYEVGLTPEGRHVAQRGVVRDDDDILDSGGLGDFDTVNGTPVDANVDADADVDVEALRAELDAVHADLGAAVARNLELEERIAFTERARDNVLQQLEEVKRSKKESGARAGEEIGRLKRELDSLKRETLASSCQRSAVDVDAAAVATTLAKTE